MAFFALALTAAGFKAYEKNENIFCVLLPIGLDFYFYKKVKEWWLKGIETQKELLKNYRTPKQKYLDSVEIKQLLFYF